MVDDKRAERRKIMSADTYYRGNRPFEKAVHEEVASKMVDLFKSKLVQEMRDSTFESTVGEGAEQVTFVLAKEYGFCWGVERSIEIAWAAREAFPDKRMHLTNELIHNPQVNSLLANMDVNFIETSATGKRFEDVGDGDVVILPAFGASLDEMQLLSAKGVKIVDTTCPWVSKVWNVVDKHVKMEMTSVVHGKWAHEESIATASMATDYIIVKDIDEAAVVAKYILGEPDALSREAFLLKFKDAMSVGFDPDVHLKKLGLANQTTMYKKETTAISKLFEKTMIQKFGPENLSEIYAAFDTICDATQVRQDAI
ncbi:LytB protein-domain-containing protein, partial [Pavlovales sp. CCMP2436]